MSAEHCVPNELRPGETLKQFHERVITQYPAEKIDPAVAFLRTTFQGTVKDELTAAIAADPDRWPSPIHFGYGMWVRNQLRKGGFGEDFWPIWNLDDIYVPLLERAAQG